MQNILLWLKRYNACDEGYAYSERFNNPITWWNGFERGDWMLWVLSRLIDRKNEAALRKLTLAKALCAKTVLHLMDDERSREAVEVAEKYGSGNATREELYISASAAYAAAETAAYAATAAAYAAAEAADYTAYAAYAAAAAAAAAAYAAASAAYATSAAACAADADSAAYAADADSAASAARKENNAQTAALIRELYTAEEVKRLFDKSNPARST